MKSIAAEETLNLNSPSTRSRAARPFTFDEFEISYVRFNSAFKEAFSQIKLWSPFAIFDPRTLPEDLTSLALHGNDDLNKLLDHYGSRQ